jgi:hypothetical protein
MWVVEDAASENVTAVPCGGGDKREPRDEVTTDGIFRESGVGS